jgi:FkbM family methyltransferase
MNKAIIKARSIARHIGLTRLYSGFAAPSQEEMFHNAISAEVRAGDVVWDVGANVGFYTKMFAEQTGHTGRVFAFEPRPDIFLRLCGQTWNFPWVQNEKVALGDFDGSSRMLMGEAMTTGRLESFPGEAGGGSSFDVKVMRGDSFWAASRTTPNLVKIDVEAFEHEVLAGMTSLMGAPELRAVFVEVHFGMLEARGRPDAPVEIEKLLGSKGLVPRWVDASHIVAKRRPA